MKTMEQTLLYQLQKERDYFNDPDHADLEFTASQVGYILQNFDAEQECYHMHVQIHSRTTVRETRFTPAEHEEMAECLDCGEWIEVDEVPTCASRKD